jgi:hypothetical protein
MIEAFLVQEENREVSQLAFWIKQVDQSSREKNTSSSVLEFRAQEIIGKHGLHRLPINVYQVAENLGAHVIFESLPNDFYMKLKAFCYKEDGFSLIGINKNHPVSRRVKLNVR